MADPCCPELYDTAKALLDFVWGDLDTAGSLAACLDDKTCEMGGEWQHYVGIGPAQLRLGRTNVFTVYTRSPALEVKYPTGVGTNMLAPTVIAHFGIELWTGCYPQPKAPDQPETVAELVAANRVHMANGLALYNRLVRAMSTAGRPGILSRCANPKLGPLQPGTETAQFAVGWRVILDADFG